jgi:hypothetical protein
MAAGRRRRLAFPSLSATAADWRNRLIGSRRFQRWAAAFPLTRRLARRDGERLFDLMAGFVYSQTLLACVELGLLRRLRGGPRHSVELAGLLGLDEGRAAALCQAAASVDLLERRRDGRFQLGRLGAAVLGVPGLEAMIRHHRIFYRDLASRGSGRPHRPPRAASLRARASRSSRGTSRGADGGRWRASSGRHPCCRGD